MSTGTVVLAALTLVLVVVPSAERRPPLGNKDDDEMHGGGLRRGGGVQLLHGDGEDGGHGPEDGDRGVQLLRGGGGRREPAGARASCETWDPDLIVCPPEAPRTATAIVPSE